MTHNKLPKDWKWVSLSKVVKFHQGYGFPKDLQGNKVGEYPFYKVGDISKNVKAGNRNLVLCDNFIDENILVKLKAKPYPINTIVFAKIGEGLKLNRRGIIKTSGVVDNNAMGLKAIENLCDDLYLYHFFNTVKLEDYSKATTVPSVRKSEIEEIQFPLPSLQTQQAIVSKIEELFSELDKGIEDLKTSQQQLKNYRQSVLKYAFEGKLTNKKVKDGELPKGWEVKILKELTLKVEKVKRKEVNENDNLIYLDIGGLDNSLNKIENYKTYTWKDAPSRAQQIVKVNDILFSTVRTYMKNIAIVDKELFHNQVASSGFTVLRANENTNFKYIFYNTISDIFLNPLNELQTGSSYPAVRDSDVFNQRIAIPPIEEQNLIVQEIESRLSVADKMEESIAQSLLQAEALRQSILKKAFSGELV